MQNTMHTNILGCIMAAMYIRGVMSGEYIVDAYGNEITVEGKTDGGTPAIFSVFDADASGQQVVLEADGRFLGVTKGGDVRLMKVAGDFSKLANKPVRIDDREVAFYFALEKVGGPGNKHVIKQGGKYMVSEDMKLKMIKYKKKGRNRNSVFSLKNTRGDAEQEAGGREKAAGGPARWKLGKEEQNIEKVLSEVLKVEKEKMEAGAKKRERSRESESADAEESNPDENSFSRDVNRTRGPSPRAPLGQRNVGPANTLPQQKGYYGAGGGKRRRKNGGGRKRRKVEDDDTDYEDMMYDVQQMMSGAQQPLLANGQQMMPGVQQTMPTAQQMMPNVQQTMPSAQQPLLANGQQMMPGVQQTMPSAQQPLLANGQQMMPGVQQTTPVTAPNAQDQNKGILARGMEKQAFRELVEEAVEKIEKRKKHGTKKENKENKENGSGGFPFGGMAKKLFDRTPIGMASSILGG